MNQFLFTLTLAAASVATLNGQTRQPVTIEHATVFLNGAELFATAKLQLPQGETSILFTNIAGSVNQQSLSIGADNQVVVQSANFQNNYLQEESASPQVKLLEDSLERVKTKQAEVNERVAVLGEQVNVLKENKQAPSLSKNGSVSDVEKMVDIIGNRMGNLLAAQRKNRTESEKLARQINQIEKQLQEERGKLYQPGGQLLVKFYTAKATNTFVRMTYVTPNAGWTPTYDIRVDDVNKPVRVVYKANVHQSCGVHWKNVRLTLSTGNPIEGAQAPNPQPWNLSFYIPVPYPNYGPVATPSSRMEAAHMRAASDATEMAAGAFKSSISANNVAASTMNQFVQVNSDGVATDFDIDLPYTIDADGREQLVSIKTHELPASYRYYAAPRLDRDAFLQARVTDWSDLNLMSAPTNVFYEGNFVGNGFLDVNSNTDTLDFSLGRDKKILIRRELNQKMRSVRTIGSNVREARQYQITVRNTRREPINLTLVDQFPLSNDKDIVIEDKEASDAVEDKERGFVTWNLRVEPAATREVKIGYTVKYPKGKTIVGFR